MGPILLAGWVLGADMAATNGVIVYVQGTVKIQRASGESVATLGVEVQESDTLVTEDNSQVRVRLFDRSLVRLGPQTRAQMSSLRYDSNGEKKEVSMKLFVGKLWASVSRLVTSDSRFEVQANSAVAGVRGTSLGVTAGANSETQVTCFDGAVNVALQGQGDRMVNGGSTLSMTRDGFGALTRLDTARLLAMAAEAQGLEQRMDERGAAERSMDAVRDRLDAAADRARDGARDRQDQARADRQRERGREDRAGLGSGLTPAEQRQRAAEQFKDINERAKSTTLRGRIDIRE